MSSIVDLGHLGGYARDGDPATYLPDLWDWLVEIGNESVLDVGCGSGVAVRHFRDLGVRVHGLDGAPQDDPDIETHDFTTGPWWDPVPFDLGWCCEFVEHVEERYVANFMTALATCRTVAMTHATPGQPGHHHVNCRTAGYWVGQMHDWGFGLDEVLTREAKHLAAKNTFTWQDDEGTHVNHFLRSGLVFKRRGA